MDNPGDTVSHFESAESNKEETSSQGPIKLVSLRGDFGDIWKSSLITGSPL